MYKNSKIKNDFLQKQQTLWRVLSFLFAMLMLGRVIRALILHDWAMIPQNGNLFSPFATLLFTFVSFVFSVFLAIRPQNVKLLGFFSISYASLVLIDSSAHPFGIFGYLLGGYILFPRSFTNKKQYYQASGIILLFLAVLGSGIRFGFVDFLRNISIATGQLLAVVGVWVMHDLQTTDIISSPKSFQLALELQNMYPDLKERDLEWLIMIAEGKSYADIALTYSLTEGTVRNSMSNLFKKMDLPGGLAEYHSRYL